MLKFKMAIKGNMKVSTFYNKAPGLAVYGSTCVINGEITTIEQAAEIVNFMRITQLTRTHMYFDYGFGCTPEAMQLISEHVIKPCKHLTKISINSLKNCQEEGLRYILDAVAINQNINKVDLSLSGMPEGNQKKFDDLVNGREYIDPKGFKALPIIKLTSSAESVNGFNIKFLEIEDKANALFEKCKTLPAALPGYVVSDAKSCTEKDALAVGQGEIGFSKQKMGTVNIKQCVVLILHDPISKAASFAHIDRIRSLDSIIQAIKSFPAYLVGAQLNYGGSEIAECNLQKVLSAIVGSERNIDIKGASVLDTIAPLDIVFNPQDGLLAHAKPDIYHGSYEKALNLLGEKHGSLSPLIQAFDFRDNTRTISARNINLDDYLCYKGYHVHDLSSQLDGPSAIANLPFNSLDSEDTTTAVVVVGNYDTEQ
jgi:hypothetical protein